VCVCLCVMVGRSVWKVYCGKSADWIQMPFGMMSGIDRGMGVLYRHCLARVTGLLVLARSDQLGTSWLMTSRHAKGKYLCARRGERHEYFNILPFYCRDFSRFPQTIYRRLSFTPRPTRRNSAVLSHRRRQCGSGIISDWKHFTVTEVSACGTS